METNNTDNNGGGAEELPVKMQQPSMQGVFLPVSILMVSVLLFLGWQLYVVKAQTSIWNRQIAQREQLVNQSRAIQSYLQRVAADLVSLALTDPDARAIIDRYQIKQESTAPSNAPQK